MVLLLFRGRCLSSDVCGSWGGQGGTTSAGRCWLADDVINCSEWERGMRKVNRVKLRLGPSAGALALLLVVSVPVIADEPDEAEDRLEEVTVTARKTTEVVQQIPIAVAVLSPQVLEQAN